MFLGVCEPYQIFSQAEDIYQCQLLPDYQSIDTFIRKRSQMSTCIKYIPFLESMFSIYSENIHTKACLIEDDGWRVTESLFTEVDGKFLVPFLIQTNLKLQCDL